MPAHSSPEYNRKWREANRDRMRYLKRKWDIANRERVRAHTRKWAQSHKLEISKRQSKWRSENPDYRKLWGQRNRKKVVLYVKRWVKKHPEYVVNIRSIRRSKLKTGDNCCQKISLLMLERFCHWCCKRLSQIHIDHIIPLSRGGRHIADNLCASCPGCNASKGTKLVEEWLPNQVFTK